MMTITPKIMIVAGEASGDIYGAGLIRAVHETAPQVRFFGIGGERMREAGCETLVDSADMAVVGLIEVLKHYKVISSAFIKLKRILQTTPPDLLVLIDYPGSICVWRHMPKNPVSRCCTTSPPPDLAWQQGRVHKLKRLVDHMAVILPFEAPFYEKAGVPVSFVGHPMADLVTVSCSRDEAAASFGLDPGRQIVGLFPGSRKSEISRLLPDILAAAGLLHQQFPKLQFLLPLASTLEEDDLAPYLAAARLPITIVRERIHELIRACDAVVSVSGTVTLEIALVQTPLVIIYKLSPITYRIARRLVKVDHIGLCNIVAGETVADELIQDDASPERIAAKISRYLLHPDLAEASRARLGLVRQRLGGGGADRRVASLIFSMLEKA